MRVWMMWWIRCIREIFLGEIRDFRPSGAGGLSAVFCNRIKWIDMVINRRYNIKNNLLLACLERYKL